MSLHHPEATPAEIIHNMTEEGYQSFSPAITPEALENICRENVVLMKLCAEMFHYCDRYAHDVFSMQYEQKIIEEMRVRGEDTREAFEELKEIDKNRHHLHDAMISSVNALIRTMILQKAISDDSLWAHEITKDGRPGYARFALLTYYNRNVIVNILH